MSNNHTISTSILDCTIRDGAHVNKGNFGTTRITPVVQALNEAKIDTIEIGFLTDLGNWTPGSTLFNTLEEVSSAIPNQLTSQISVMIRPDQCDFEKLDAKIENIDVLRFAFHEEHLDITEKYIDKALALGYEVCANPVNVMSYDKAKLRSVLDSLKVFDLSTISIVDTFGSLKHDEFIEYCELFDEHLNENVKLGLHLHENFSQTFGLICTAFAQIRSSRQLVVDSSLMGMGRIPGNLCTEIIVSHLNSFRHRYNMSPLLKAISEEIIPEKEKNNWGYHPVYMLTAERNMHRSYGEYLVSQDVKLNIAEDILNVIAKSGKIDSYDANLAEITMKQVIKNKE